VQRKGGQSLNSELLLIKLNGFAEALTKKVANSFDPQYI
jgi:hypothetical protein